MFSLARLVAPWLTGNIVDVGLDPAARFQQGFPFAGCLMSGGGILAAVLIHLACFGEHGSSGIDLLAEASNDRREFPNPQVSRGIL